MKKLVLLVFLLFAGCSWVGQTMDQTSEKSTASATDEIVKTGTNSNTSTFTGLTHVQTYSLPSGTHRPEILVRDNAVYLLVVYPDGADHQHQGMMFNFSDVMQLDFNNPAEQFPVSWVTKEFGRGADHRAVIMGDEIWVVVQSLVIDPTKSCMGGPMEPCTKSQHLLFSRFTLDGEEIATTELANTDDFPEDNYPDMSIVPKGDHLLVSTGTKAGFEQGVKIREIDKTGTIVAEYEYDTSPSGILGGLGNSLYFTDDGKLLLLSSTNTQLGVSVLKKDFELSESKIFTLPDEENTFPTSVMYHEGYYYVGYSARSSGDMAIESNPLSPRLLVLDKNLEVVDVITVSNEPGTGHVHPTLTIIDNVLLYTWSKKIGMTPQVQVEIYQL